MNVYYPLSKKYLLENIKINDNKIKPIINKIIKNTLYIDFEFFYSILIKNFKEIIQSFDINLPFQRESLNSLGWELALDRQINIPITVDLSFAAIYKNLNYSGSYLSQLNQNNNILNKCNL